MLSKRESFMERNPNFSAGMHVYGQDGGSLGRVISVDENSFTIERGVFFPKDFTLRYDDIAQIQDNKVTLSQSVQELKEWKSPSYTGWDHVESVNRGEIRPLPTESFKPQFESIPAETVKGEIVKGEAVKVPVFEEELEARKVARQIGEVSIRKIVHTELKHLTVPLSHEDVKVVHIDTGRRVLSNEEAQKAFAQEESSIQVPIMDEDVELGKRTVLKEEIQVQKQRTTEQRDYSDRVRSEEVEIKGEDQIRKRKVG